MSLSEYGPARPSGEVTDDPRQPLLPNSLLDNNIIVSDHSSGDGGTIVQPSSLSGRGGSWRCSMALGATLPILALLLIGCVALTGTAEVALEKMVGRRSNKGAQTFDVLIIGAGAAGLTAAKELQKTKGLKVKHSPMQGTYSAGPPLQQTSAMPVTLCRFASCKAA